MKEEAPWIEREMTMGQLLPTYIKQEPVEEVTMTTEVVPTSVQAPGILTA